MVLIHLADGFEEIEAISVIDVLRRAEVEVQTVSIMGRKEVHGAHGITVLADTLYENVAYTDAEMLILPGGGQGTQNLDQHAGLNEKLVAAAAQGKWVAAICAAPTVLGRLGILKGKSATCYPGCEDALQGANVSSANRTIIDGKIITSRGPGTSLDFALTLVELLKSRGTAETLRKQMIID